MTNTQWRMASSSSSCTHLSRNCSSGSSPRAAHAASTASSSDASCLRGGDTPGNRSPSSPKKGPSSTVGSLGVLKSRSARMSSTSSGRCGSARLKEPATTSTDLMARSPQS